MDATFNRSQNKFYGFIHELRARNPLFLWAMAGRPLVSL